MKTYWLVGEIYPTFFSNEEMMRSYVQWCERKSGSKVKVLTLVEKTNFDKLQAVIRDAVSTLEKIGCLGFRAKREECTCFRCKGLTNLEEVLK